MHSTAEENYIKAIYKLTASGEGAVSTNGLAELLETKPASVSDMLRKLHNKELVQYEKYRGAQLTEEGRTIALKIIRKHRLWEVFLVEKLHFSWDEVHEVAEQLEHIKSERLIQRLDEFLGNPPVDPHGDPIPSETGEISIRQHSLLADMQIAEEGKVVGVNDDQPLLLQYLDKIGLSLGSNIKVIDKIYYDNSLEISINESQPLCVSNEIAKNIFLSS